MTTQPLARSHPVLDYARGAHDRLDALADRPVWSMTPAEQREALVELSRLEARTAALRLRVLAEADRSGATDHVAAPSAADWLATETRQTRPAARADLKLATALETHPVLAAACGAGRVNPAQAAAIATALDRLPTTGEFAVSAEQRTHAEEHLVGLAAHHDARALRVLGRRIFEVIAPDLAERFEGKALEAEEAAALRRTTLTMREDDEGTCHGRFRIPRLHGHLLRTLLQSLTNPTRETDRPEAPPERHPAPVRDGLAFCELLERLPTTPLPRHGGPVTVVVTITLDQLTTGLGAAQLIGTGETLSAAEARRLACRAGLVPAVLDGQGRVLDLGRKARFHTDAMHLALALEQRGCTALHCQVPPAMCHAHHDKPWSAGGDTSTTNGRLLCGHHHRRIHDPRYTVTHHPNGQVEFHRRT